MKLKFRVCDADGFVPPDESSISQTIENVLGIPLDELLSSETTQEAASFILERQKEREKNQEQLEDEEENEEQEQEQDDSDDSDDNDNDENVDTSVEQNQSMDQVLPMLLKRAEAATLLNQANANHRNQTSESEEVEDASDEDDESDDDGESEESDDGCHMSIWLPDDLKRYDGERKRRRERRKLERFEEQLDERRREAETRRVELAAQSVEQTPSETVERLREFVERAKEAAARQGRDEPLSASGDCEDELEEPPPPPPPQQQQQPIVAGSFDHSIEWKTPLLFGGSDDDDDPSTTAGEDELSMATILADMQALAAAKRDEMEQRAEELKRNPFKAAILDAWFWINMKRMARLSEQGIDVGDAQVSPAPDHSVMPLGSVAESGCAVDELPAIAAAASSSSQSACVTTTSRTRHRESGVSNRLLQERYRQLTDKILSEAEARGMLSSEPGYDTMSSTADDDADSPQFDAAHFVNDFLTEFVGLREQREEDDEYSTGDEEDDEYSTGDEEDDEYSTGDEEDDHDLD
jgi:hypothetical protein